MVKLNDIQKSRPYLVGFTMNDLLEGFPEFANCRFDDIDSIGDQELTEAFIDYVNSRLSITVNKFIVNPEYNYDEALTAIDSHYQKQLAIEYQRHKKKIKRLEKKHKRHLETARQMNELGNFLYLSEDYLIELRKCLKGDLCQK